MTIKELEERTGMTRANIRFYESEGLLSPAQREFNCFNYDLAGWLALWDERWDSFELDYRGVHISQTVECSGYTGVGQIREPVEGRDQVYRRTVTISLNGSE